MPDEGAPTTKIGYLVPGFLIENQAYEFYRFAPPGVLLVLIPCGLDAFTAEAAQRVVGSYDGLLDRLMKRDPDLILQAGVPPHLIGGIDAHDALVKHMRERTGRPVLTQMQNVIAAIKHLKLKNIVAVNLWTDAMNVMLGRFFARDGITLAAACNRSQSMTEFGARKQRDAIDLAYDLCAQAFHDHPEADGLYIGGGNWMAQPVVEKLEAEFGRPVICNSGASLRGMLQAVGKWRPLPGHGALLSAD